MKNILKQLILLTIFTFIFIYCVKYNNYIAYETMRSCKLWLTKVVPSLFPSFILIDLITNSSLPYFINKYLKINVFYFISILSGSPSNAYLLNNYDIDKTKLMSVSKYTSLIFTYNFLKLIFNKTIAIKLVLLNIICNFILIIFIKPPKINYPLIEKTNIVDVVLKSINKNVIVLLNILGTIIFFNILPINMINNIYLKSVILSFTEVTNSFINLSLINIPLNFKLLFTIISLSTCGLCIEFQIKSIIKDTYIDYKKYFLYRFFHFILLFCLTCFLIIK